MGTPSRVVRMAEFVPYSSSRTNRVSLIAWMSWTECRDGAGGWSMGSPGIAFPEARTFASMSFANENLSKQQAFEGIVGCSTGLMETLDLVRTVAPTDSTVLIEGEAGTGKEVIASAIHACSKRRDRAFIKLNCTAIPVGLLESELFGHERGVLTVPYHERSVVSRPLTGAHLSSTRL